MDSVRAASSSRDCTPLRTRSASSAAAKGPRPVGRSMAGPTTSFQRRPSSRPKSAIGTTSAPVARTGATRSARTAPARRRRTERPSVSPTISPARSSPSTSSGRASTPPRRRNAGPTGTMSGTPATRTKRPVASRMPRLSTNGSDQPKLQLATSNTGPRLGRTSAPTASRFQRRANTGDIGGDEIPVESPLVDRVRPLPPTAQRASRRSGFVGLRHDRPSCSLRLSQKGDRRPVVEVSDDFGRGP